MNIKAIFLKFIHNEKYSTFLIVFFVLLLSFGIMIPFLGYYWDDWEFILIAKQYPLNQFWNYFAGGRPLAAWAYVFITPLIGLSKIMWQIVALVFRACAVFGLWWVLSIVWPAKKNKNLWVALIFAIYPVFRQQAIAVCYYQHWLAFTLYFFSVGMMLKGVSAKSNKWLWILGSAIFQFGHMSILEYFWGLELLRPVFCWIHLNEGDFNFFKRLKKVFLTWLPNFIILISFFIWRVLIVNVEANSPVLLLGLLSNPFDSISKFISHMVQDVIYVLLGSWFDTVSPEIMANFPTSLQLIQIVIFMLIVVTTYVLLSKHDLSSDTNNKSYLRGIFVVGIIALLLGGAQIWITDRQTYSKFPVLNADRFLLPSMPGAALLCVAFIDWFGKNTKAKVIIISILIALSGVFHFRIGNDYRWSRINQERVYWQLYWRAPWVEPEANFISDQLPFAYVLPTFSFHALYDQPENIEDGMGRFYLAREFTWIDEDKLFNGLHLESHDHGFNFSSNSTDSLILYYHPDEDNNCVWILNQNDVDQPMISEDVRYLLELSNTNLIKQSHESYSGPDPVIFGNEPEHNWCYYYQKAELARQYEAWDEILLLSEEAASAGYDTSNSQSNSPYEWIPFIQAYMKTGNWNIAADTLVSTYRTNSKYREMLCRIWKENSAGVEAQTSFDASDDQVNEVLECNALYK